MLHQLVQKDRCEPLARPNPLFVQTYGVLHG